MVERLSVARLEADVSLLAVNLYRHAPCDGIAADLGLSLATVKTYRTRAFERLNIRFKSELFAAFIHQASRQLGHQTNFPAALPE
jgi:DNA-binding CsgD family transcriptional regulator